MDLPGCQKKQPPPPGPKQYELSAKVTSAINRIEAWSDEDKFQLTCELIKTFGKDTQKCKKLMNLSRDLMASSKKEVCEQQRIVDSGASGGGPPPLPKPIAAAKVPMICRGDLIASTSLLFFDTEKVTIAQSHENKSGDLAIVDISGRLLFWTYIRQDNVCKFNTKLTGLDQNKMDLGLTVETVKEILSKLLQNKDLWGASSFDDAKSLGFIDGFFLSSNKTHDIQSFYRDSKNRPIGLGMLSEHFLGENVQSKTHSSITDARLTALCYRKMIDFRKLGMSRFSCPLMDEIRRQPVQKKQMHFDKCTCGKSVANSKAKKNKKQFANKSEEFSSYVNFYMENFV